MPIEHPSLIGFADFVSKKARKNPDEPINHATWNSCAFGDYVKQECDRFTDPFCAADDVFTDRTLRDLIGNGDCGNTYGELTKSLQPYVSVA